MDRRCLFLPACLMLVAGTSVLAQPVTLTAVLTGKIGPTRGDPDAIGGFTAVIDAANNDLCYALWGERVGRLKAAHLHFGPRNFNGSALIPLDVTGKASDECIAVEGDRLQGILDHPAEYYISIRTDDYPAGAIRGQLARP